MRSAHCLSKHLKGCLVPRVTVFFYAQQKISTFSCFETLYIFKGYFFLQWTCLIPIFPVVDYLNCLPYMASNKCIKSDIVVFLVSGHFPYPKDFAVSPVSRHLHFSEVFENRKKDQIPWIFFEGSFLFSCFQTLSFFKSVWKQDNQQFSRELEHGTWEVYLWEVYPWWVYPLDNPTRPCRPKAGQGLLTQILFTFDSIILFTISELNVKLFHSAFQRQIALDSPGCSIGLHVFRCHHSPLILPP